MLHKFSLPSKEGPFFTLLPKSIFSLIKEKKPIFVSRPDSSFKSGISVQDRNRFYTCRPVKEYIWVVVIVVLTEHQKIKIQNLRILFSLYIIYVPWILTAQFLLRFFFKHTLFLLPTTGIPTTILLLLLLLPSALATEAEGDVSTRFERDLDSVPPRWGAIKDWRRSFLIKSRIFHLVSGVAGSLPREEEEEEGGELYSDVLKYLLKFTAWHSKENSALKWNFINKDYISISKARKTPLIQEILLFFIEKKPMSMDILVGCTKFLA